VSLFSNKHFTFRRFYYQVGNNSVGGGIVVSKVADGGPASKEEGLKVHDRILKVRPAAVFVLTPQTKPFSRACITVKCTRSLSAFA